MENRDKIRLSLTGWGLLLWVVLSGCGSGSREGAGRDLSALEALLQEGDLVFRRGQGLASRAVLAADNHSVYSHTGIVVRDSTGWMVVHAVPGEPDYPGDRGRIKMEPVERFFTPKRAIKGAVMRLKGDPEAGRAAARHAVRLFRAGILFDHDYNLDDTSRLYCTELIRRVFLYGGIDPAGGKRSRIDLPGFRGDYILPGDIQHSAQLEPIYEF